MSGFPRFIAKVAEGQSLTADEAAEAFAIMMSGEASAAQMGAFLMGLRVRGETVEEITGAAQAMRAKATTVKAPEGAVDTCGTGGDAKGTYNISTCTAFVVAGAGVPVAKHGNKSVSSKSGSADVLAALGVNLDVGPQIVSKAIEEAGVGMIQLRNLNVDPEFYRQHLPERCHGPGLGLAPFALALQERFPRLQFGYFNPPKEQYSLWRNGVGLE